MPSPFPGMDPYLEAHWGDVHAAFTLYARDEIQSRLPRDLRARVEEYLTVEDDEERKKRYSPDVRIIERPEFLSSPSAVATMTATEPLVIEAYVEPLTLRSIHIVDTRSGNRIVTAIEFVSPGNKQGRSARQQYRQKRFDLLRGRTNVVEIDLTRQGPNLLAIPANRVPPSHRTPYRVCVTRTAFADRFEIYRLPLQEKLPTIRIPLRPSDGDVFLDLQTLVEKVWRQGGYDDIDYSVDPEPPLKGRDAAWCDERLAQAGFRPKAAKS